MYFPLLCFFLVSDLTHSHFSSSNGEEKIKFWHKFNHFYPNRVQRAVGLLNRSSANDWLLFHRANISSWLLLWLSGYSIGMTKVQAKFFKDFFFKICFYAYGSRCAGMRCTKIFSSLCLFLMTTEGDIVSSAMSMILDKLMQTLPSKFSIYNFTSAGILVSCILK